MALATAKRLNTEAGSSTVVNSASAKCQWEKVNNDAKTTTSTPTTISNLTTSTAFWTRVGSGVTRISAIRQDAAGTITGGATVTIIGCDKWDISTNAPASDAKYRTVTSALALGTTTDITHSAGINSTAQTNSGNGWDLLGDEAFLVAVTTGATGSSTITVEAKLTN